MTETSAGGLVATCTYPRAGQMVTYGNKRFNELHPKAQEYLLNLREQDIDELKDALEIVRMLKNTGRFIRWAWITLAVFTMGMVSLTDGWRKFVTFVRGLAG